MTNLTSAECAQLVIQALQPFFGWKMLFSCILQLSELIQTPQNGGLGVWGLTLKRQFGLAPFCVVNNMASTNERTKSDR
jgi:hypothetical protein